MTNMQRAIETTWLALPLAGVLFSATFFAMWVL